MTQRRRLLNYVMPAAASALMAGALVNPASAEPAIITGSATVIDGDTINVGVVAIRLHGIDAPEVAQQCEDSAGKLWPCGVAATARMAQLIKGVAVSCVALDRDAYQRVIARCTASGRDIGGALIDEGLAWAFVRYSGDYVAAEAKAKSAAVGVWRGTSELPWDYRANRWQRASEAAPKKGCPIKGNVNRKGERIYHTPWSPWYATVTIDESRGGRWFCDEREAVEAGWRAARSR